MADKTYKELSKRLKTKKKTGNNFRSYEEVRKRKRDETAGTSMPEKPASQTAKPTKTSKTKRYSLPQIKIDPRLLVGLIVIGVVTLGFYALFRKNATEVRVYNDVIGQIKSTKVTQEDILDTVSAKLKQKEGTDVQIEDEIELVLVHGKKKLLMDESEIINKLEEQLNIKVKAAEITVDGEAVGIVQSMEEAESLFQSVMSKYEPEGEENVTSKFVEDVAANDKFVKKEYIVPSETVKVALEESSVITDVYIVKDGDTLSKIAGANGMTMDELAKNNPGMDITQPIRVGDGINVVSYKPFVSVETTVRKTETVPIERGVVEEPDSGLPAGQKRIIKEGKDGKKEVTKETVMINGVVVSTSDVSEEIIEAAEPQVVANGTA